MVAQNGESAKRNESLAWPALLGKRTLRGTPGLGLHAACWISENLQYPVVAMWPISRMDGRKVPLEKWKYLEYRTPLEIRRESKFRMRCGVGILAGKAGLVVIDIDDEQAWKELVADQEMPATLELSTHAGRQLIFRDNGVLYKTQGSQLAPGVDVRGRGGLFVVYDPDQPERHFTDLTSPASVPPWLQRLIPLAGSRARAGRSKSGSGAVELDKAMVAGIPHGEHHSKLLALALSLVNQGKMVDREVWFTFASTAIRKGSDSCNCTNDQIYGWYDTAVEKKLQEDKRKKEARSKLYHGAEITISAADVPDVDVEWVWSQYIVIGSFTQIDGEKGYAKSFTLADVIARATRGWPMPGEESAICEPMNVFIFTEEVMAQNKKKLRAADADLSRVFYPHPDFREKILDHAVKKKGLADAMSEASDEVLQILLPTGTDLILEMISKANAGLVIWDPISHYVDADKVNTNSDAAVRRALDPLMRGLDDIRAAGVLVRHMNKDAGARARHRGSGTTAFQNVGRVHLVMGRLADEHSESGTFGLSMVDNNYTRVVRGTLAFDVVDSDVRLDSLGHYVGKVEWHDLEEDIDADALVRGSGDGNGKKGPKPVKRAAVIHILDEMGKVSGTWDAREAREHIYKRMAEEGHDAPNPRTIDSARQDSMIRTVSRRGEIGKNDWIWPAHRAPRLRS